MLTYLNGRMIGLNIGLEGSLGSFKKDLCMSLGLTQSNTLSSTSVIISFLAFLASYFYFNWLINICPKHLL